jgi:hypothetical protein
MALLAQLLIHVGFTRAARWPARMSGYAVARQMLDGTGLYELGVEQTQGKAFTYFDVRRQRLELSADVFHGRHLAATGFAAHAARHAIEAHAGRGWSQLRELAVTAATFGSGAGIVLAATGLLIRFPPFLALGVGMFAGVVFFELLVLPVELVGSVRAERKLLALGIVPDEALGRLRWVLVVAALANLAETLQSVPALIRYSARLSKPREPDL